MAFLRLSMVSTSVLFLVIFLSYHQPSAFAAPPKTPGKAPPKTPAKPPPKAPGKAPPKTPAKSPPKAPAKPPPKAPGKAPPKAPAKPPPKAPAKAPPKAPPPLHANFILAIQWAYTVCNGRATCPKSLFQKEFTIHGLWSSPEPVPCTGPNPYNPALLTSIKAKLEKDWINAEKSDNNGFWKHEYDKHGVCSKFGNTRAYFDKGLEAYGTVKRLGNFLVTEFAGKAVSEGLIYAKLKSQLQSKDFAMICRTAKGKSQLQELRLYFKYQAGTGIRGWTQENLPKQQLKRCPKGNITLPLV